MQGFVQKIISAVLVVSLAVQFQCGVALAEDGAAAKNKKEEYVAVLDLDAGGGVSEETARAVTESIRSEFVNSGMYRVLDRANMDKIVKEQGVHVGFSCNDRECAIEIGKILGANKIVVGSLRKMGGGENYYYKLALWVVDVESSAMKASDDMKASGADEICADCVGDASVSLFAKKVACEKILGCEPVKVAKAEKDLAAQIKREKERIREMKEEEDKKRKALTGGETSWGWWIAGGLAILAGAALAGGGGGGKSSSNNNNTGSGGTVNVAW